MKKIIGYSLIGFYLIFYTVNSAINIGWHALWVVPVCLLFWIGLGILIGWLLN